MSHEDFMRGEEQMRLRMGRYLAGELAALNQLEPDDDYAWARLDGKITQIKQILGRFYLASERDYLLKLYHVE